ncbi:hypothetical protein EVAR_101612_1, partial [Eumeta japonica]
MPGREAPFGTVDRSPGSGGRRRRRGRNAPLA